MLVLSLCGSAVVPVAAQQGDARWHFVFTPVAWAMATGGRTGVPPLVSNASRSFGDIVHHAAGGLSGTLEARRGHFVASLDAVYGPIAAESTVTLAGTPVLTRIQQKDFIVQPQLGVTVLAQRDKDIAVVIGARAWYLSSQLRTLVTGVAVGPISRSRGWLDGTIGARARVTPNPLVHFFVNGDVGAGASTLSWQVQGGLAVDLATWCSATVAYRHLDVDYETVYVEDVYLTGPAMGFVFRF
jgi:hypothetical protein